jgi:hypothetical protein
MQWREPPQQTEGCTASLKNFMFALCYATNGLCILFTYYDMHDVINTSQLIYVSQPTACAHHKPCLLTFLFVGSNGRLRNKRTLLLLFYFKQCRIHPSPSIRSQPTTPHARTPSLSYKQLHDHSKNREAPSRYKLILSRWRRAVT